jgi:hypothetical protein
MSFGKVYSGLRMLAVCAILGISAVWLLENFFKTSSCYNSRDSASILQSLKQEPVWRGIVVEDNQEKMVAVFGNIRNGAWTRVNIEVNGNVCFVETGTDFQSASKDIINL